ncbi:MAG: SAM-dependent methyltransferase [Deltaproteobacteria bacterium]|nr:MAG: SAM-dependent methyltransferase [Deltaproteobacteria bacterium]
MKPFKSRDVQLHPHESMDSFLDGRLKLIQSRNGYRFSIDAVFLSGFVKVKPGDILVDLGTGCGIIPLMILLTKPLGHAFGLEIQRELADQALRNSILNGCGDRLDIIQGDIRCLCVKDKCVDIVICNPPYRKVKSGRINPDSRRAIARHELMVSIDDVLKAAGRCLRKKGRLAVSYPAERLMDILTRMRRFNLEPKRVQINYPDLQTGGKLVFVEAALGGNPGMEILPPLIGQGNFSVR